MQTSYTYLIIGSSAAGMAAAFTLRKLDPSASICCITQEAEPPYNKCLLADIACGTRPFEAVYTRTHIELDAHNILLFTSCTVESIDFEQKTANTTRGIIGFGKLLLTTGTAAYTPVILQQLSKRFYFHTLHDVTTLLAYIKDYQPRAALVIGAGLSGLEASDVLLTHGVQPTIIEQSSGILPRQLPSAVQQYVQDRMKVAGASVKASCTIVDAQQDNSGTTITFDDGTECRTDIIIVAAGSRASAQHLITSALAHDQGFLLVNEHLQTSHEYVFAAGDAIVTRNKITGEPTRSTLWPDAVQQGVHAAHAMVGLPRPYAGVIPMVSSQFFGIKVVSCGIVQHHPMIADIQEEIAGNEASARIYNAQQELIGFVLIGNTSQLPQLRKQLRSA